MAARIYLPVEDESQDEVIRITDAESLALHRLLMRMSQDDMTGGGLTVDECRLVRSIGSVLR